MRTRSFALILLCTLTAFAAETLRLRFDQPGTLHAGQTELALDNRSADGWLYGEKGLSLPANTLLSNNAGTVFFRFARTDFKEPLLVPRYILTLRTHSRLTVTLSLYANNAGLNFGFSDRTSGLHYRHTEPLPAGHHVDLAFSYDGKTVRFYIDGMLRKEGPQPVPIENLHMLNLGPYRDRWLAPQPWGNDSVARELRTWNHTLTPAEIAALSGAELKPLTDIRPQVLTIPRCPVSSPQIDGSLQDEAWKFAASQPQLIYGDFKQKSWEIPPSRFLLTYDRENIYLGFESRFPGGVPLQEGSLRSPENEGEVWGSESFELYLEIDGKRYRFGGNVAGGYVEWLGNDSNWNGQWLYRKSLAMQIDDSKIWQGEASIPWKTIGLDAPPDTLRFNFCRTWQIPNVGKISSLSLNGKTYGSAEDMTEARLTTAAPVMQLGDRNNPALGDFIHDIALAAVGAKGQVRYRLESGKLDGTIPPQPLFDRTYNLAANEFFNEKIQVQLTSPEADALIFSCLQGNQVVACQIVPFKLNEDLFAITPLFLSEKISFNVRQALLRKKFGADFAGELHLFGPGDVTTPQQRLPITADRLDLPFPRTAAAGLYRTTLCRASDGQVLGEAEFNYPGLGEWEKATYPQLIIPPFTPLQSHSDGNRLTASVYGREYQWQNSLLPQQITSQGVPLLSGAVTLIANGTPVPGLATAAAQAPHRLDLTQHSDTADLTLSGSSWLEYDGVQFNQLRLTAKKDLAGIRLQFTLPTAIAKYLHGAGGGSWGSRTTRLLPDGSSDLRFYPVLWLGNEEVGLCFFAESRRLWRSSRQRTFLFNKQADNTTVEVLLADRLAAGETFEFDFGLLAGPVRPLPANYPLNTLSWSHVVKLNRPGQTPVSDVVYMATNQGDLGSFFADQDTLDARKRAAELKQVSEQSVAHGGRPVPYTCAMYLSVKYPEMAAFRPEWVVIPEMAMDYDSTGHFVYDCCPTTSASAFFVERYRDMLKKFPDIKGIYFDFGGISECSNTLHGCDQRFPILAQREFMRRIAITQLQAGISDPITVLHNTDVVLLPAFTFATHLLNGEQVRQASSSTLHQKKDILDTYGLDMFACELATLPFGITNSVYMPFDKLNERYGGDEADAPYKFRMSKAALAAILPHNTMPCLWRNHYGIFDKIIRAYAAFDVPAARFHGYWKQPASVRIGDDILVSVYRHARENRLLAVIGHIGKPHVNQNLEIVFDTAALGVSNLRRATDLMTAPDPAFAELLERQKKYRVELVRAPLELGNFGSHVTSFDGTVLKLALDFHSFALVELGE